MLQVAFAVHLIAHVNRPLAVGDELLIQHFAFCTLGERPQRIAADGTVLTIDLGQVHILGLTVSQAEAKLDKHLAAKYKLRGSRWVSILRIRGSRPPTPPPEGRVATPTAVAFVACGAPFGLDRRFQSQGDALGCSLSPLQGDLIEDEHSDSPVVLTQRRKVAKGTLR